MKRLRIRTNDDGAVLVLVLIFVVVVGVVVGAVIDQTRASIGNTVVVRNQQALTFAADAGVERAIQQVRKDSSLCAASGSPVSMGSMTSNGRTVDLTCQVIQGSSSGVLGYAVVTTDATGDSLTTSGGGTKTINGPVWTARIDDAISNLVIEGGDLLEKASDTSCVVGGAQPSGLDFEPAGLYGYTCSSAALPNFAPTLPTAVPADAPPASPPTDVGECRVFFPGTYTSTTWPGFLEQNYFVSGVYYFVDVDLTVTGTQEVVAGRRGASEADSLGLTACSNDLAQAGNLPTDTDTGVKWLFGGSTTLTTTNSGGSIEIFARSGGPASEGTQGVPIMQVLGASGTWTNSTRTASQNIIDIQSGTNPAMVAHGIIYVPSARVNIDNAANIAQAQFQGGIMAGRLHAQAPANSTGLVISMETDASPRLVRVTATTNLDAGDKKISAHAVLWIEDDAERTAHVQSWRSTN